MGSLFLLSSAVHASGYWAETYRAVVNVGNTPNGIPSGWVQGGNSSLTTDGKGYTYASLACVPSDSQGDADLEWHGTLRTKFTWQHPYKPNPLPGFWVRNEVSWSQSASLGGSAQVTIGTSWTPSSGSGSESWPAYHSPAGSPYTLDGYMKAQVHLSGPALWEQTTFASITRNWYMIN